MSPEPLTEFAKTTFGTADKPVLLGGMAAIALVAAAAGLASRRRAGPGIAVIAVLGLAGTTAVVSGASLRAAALIAPLVALAVGVPTFVLLHRAARPARTARPARPARSGIARRAVLIGGVAVAAVAAGGASLLLGGGVTDARRAVTDRLARARLAERAPAIPAGADFAAFGTPTFLTSNAGFHRIDTALQVPQLRAEDWPCGCTAWSAGRPCCRPAGPPAGRADRHHDVCVEPDRWGLGVHGQLCGTVPAASPPCPPGG
ncbi:hypothetical protein [Pseudonocardia terrae]|uniref:hypothetical protein n=1 Tax=Pseudonocardia terrae TaxID=2905831 RepID=UPI0027E10B08|nr:hypothetical protein [Pseudonocardia terrae]